MRPETELGDEATRADYLEAIRSMLKLGSYGELEDNTELFKDLGLSGDDAYDFLASFEKKFRVEPGSFDFCKHFPLEGEHLWRSLISVFRRKKPHDYYIAVTISDLARIAQAPKWDM